MPELAALPVIERAPLRRAPLVLEYGDPLRVLACIAVLVCHAATPARRADVSEFGWWVCCTLDLSCIWAVPVFLMLSGAILLDPARTEAPGQFYRKRLFRLGPALVFWSAVFIPLTLPLKTREDLLKVGEQLALGLPSLHLYFVFVIAGLYAATPMLRVFIAHASPGLLRMATLMLLGMAAANQLLRVVVGGQETVATRFCLFLGTYLSGYWLRDVRLTRKQAGWIIAGLVLLLAAMVVASSMGIEDRQLRWVARTVRANPGLPRILLALGMWLLLTNLLRGRWARNIWWCKAIEWLVPLTLGIYLMHPLLSRAVPRIPWLKMPEHWYLVPAIVLVEFGLCAVAVSLIQKIPYVRRIVG